ncbi:hypothetical protein [Alteribacillus bidgolensis]|uniref:hypothetical protein n=1 Tax=Alteribacillus bidgolensis TaxID=930129 RepID=UPI001476715A|nr:hypothetical protein [Alteribacillus bidgolensis]
MDKYLDIVVNHPDFWLSNSNGRSIFLGLKGFIKKDYVKEEADRINQLPSLIL